MVKATLKAGARVTVPWGLGRVPGTVVEVFGDPPTHVRVQIDLDDDLSEDEEPVVLLLSPEVVEAA